VIEVIIEIPVPFLSQREVKYNWEQMANVGTNITPEIPMLLMVRVLPAGGSQRVFHD